MIKNILVILILFCIAFDVFVYAGIDDMTPAVKEKATSLYDKNYKPQITQEIKLDAAEVILVDGVVFKHAGFGATIGFNGKRLNYTGKDNTGLVGPFLVDKNGNLFIEHVEFKYEKSKDPYQPDWKLIKSKIIRVKEVSWDFKDLKEEFTKSPCKKCQQ